MKLLYSPTSAFVRKVLVTAIETGLRDGIELVPTDVWDAVGDGARDNPLGKVPALITYGGEALFDSRVICEHLDSLHGGRKLFPRSGDRRWRALRRQALGDGILDAAVLLVYEGRRPKELRSAEWTARQKAKIDRALDRLEAEAPGVGEMTIGHVAIACALGYLDFRLGEDDWRPGRAALGGWFQTMCERPSFATTRHEERT